MFELIDYGDQLLAALINGGRGSGLCVIIDGRYDVFSAAASRRIAGRSRSRFWSEFSSRRRRGCGGMVARLLERNLHKVFIINDIVRW